MAEERLWLHKISFPGWSRKFDTEVDLVEFLRDRICTSCLTDDIVPPIDYNDLDDLLYTACGLEYMADNEPPEIDHETM